eukprot:Phypoly_transcript_20711.p1 GENE.Phypoly_transcript_20711~~Phypoly_transcript_20711.p1  ORF type:complete len:162 (+),score=9.80 Phypoly_transcript_20711:167-652(+)
MTEYTGILFVHLIDAKKLIIADVISSDPYAIFKVGSQSVKSKVIESSLNPVWNEHLQLCVNGLKNKLEITLYSCCDTFFMNFPDFSFRFSKISNFSNFLTKKRYDKDDLNADDFLGQCELELTILDQDGYRNGEYMDIILPLKNVKQGSIHFKISYNPISH